MLRVGLIGQGAIAQYVAAALPAINASLACVVVRTGREDTARQTFGTAPIIATSPDVVPVDVFVDCAGHEGLRQHGPEILASGVPLITVSLGALADDALHRALIDAANSGATTLHLCSGAIGGLDALRAARVGQLDAVSYTGRKPPKGWAGSRAEEVLDLAAILSDPIAHFTGTAREAALLYPKNANVAAAVALAGLGFDATSVTLIADPAAGGNLHEIHAKGTFGQMRFSITGDTLPGNPRTSALAAMSVVQKLAELRAPMRF